MIDSIALFLRSYLFLPITHVCARARVCGLKTGRNVGTVGTNLVSSLLSFIYSVPTCPEGRNRWEQRWRTLSSFLTAWNLSVQALRIISSMFSMPCRVFGPSVRPNCPLFGALFLGIMRREFPIAGVVLEVGMESYSWLVVRCPWCGRAHRHGGGLLASDDPRAVLSCRAGHDGCGPYELVDLCPAGTFALVCLRERLGVQALRGAHGLSVFFEPSETFKAMLPGWGLPNLKSLSLPNLKGFEGMAL
jgi:hypothetical protein